MTKFELIHKDCIRFFEQMSSDYRNYFWQTKEWASFWKKANASGHEVYQIHCQLTEDPYQTGLQAYIYRYPWYFGQNFLYLPRGPVLVNAQSNSISAESAKSLWQAFGQELGTLAKQLGSVFVKLDFDDHLARQLKLTDTTSFQTFLQNYWPNQRFNWQAKALQYTQTLVLDCSNLKLPETNSPFVGESLELDTLRNFFEVNTSFWSTVNQTTRRYTRKSLAESWSVDLRKNPQTFSEFWQILRSTSRRQGFSTHPKDYYATLLKQDFSRLLILRDTRGKAQAAWLGISLNRSLVYLYGGNLDKSRSHYGQYLLHLSALYLATVEGCVSYDLGGYQADSGYGQFKAGYGGLLKTFLGPVDIIFKPKTYALINFLRQLVHHIRELGKTWKHLTTRVLLWLFKFSIALLITSSLPLWGFTVFTYWPKNVNLEEFTIALVLGAGVDANHLRPTPVLQKRLDQAASLYQQGKVKTILVSGDNRLANYNEPLVMKKYLIDQGVPAGSVVEDFGGRRTMDTCWRAKNVFQAKKVYLITQKFHLPRATYSCVQMGLQVVPVAAENSSFNTTVWGVIREIPASWLVIQETLKGYEAPVGADGTEPQVES